MDIGLAQRKMAESENSSISSTGELTKNEKIYASDLYSRTQVDKLIKDPTYNTPSACVGYGLDVLGGY